MLHRDKSWEDVGSMGLNKGTERRMETTIP